MVSFHKTALSPTSRRHCDNRPADRKEHSSIEEPRLDKETEEHQREDNNTYAVGWVDKRVGSGPSSCYVVRWYGYSTAEDTA